MAPILHIMRHGQGEHSSAVNKDGKNVRDAPLTQHGKDQCAERCKNFPSHDKIDLLLASPLRRALQTCVLSFAPSIARGQKILALPMAEEASDDPCDTGSPVEVLKKEFPDIVLFDHVEHGWYLHEGEYAVDPKALNARAAKLRRFIRDRDEKEVVLVTHGFFAHYLTGDVNEKGEQTTGWWQETELRTFDFVDGGEKAVLRETGESLQRNGVVSKDGQAVQRSEQSDKPA
ncbi:hypothetical protein LTR02_008892 [Friedmanniomyces endolithicus]|nr:hypothetical protein LTR94_006058 [Friedmanniomyces endolithicus]KAK0787531.1 hypothetical protein LTR38_011629 [Friedmanniomyces endolithicus]KAK0803010.1 hypothetical protein LTR59_004857 [Friedmanniomyces endolithicus]KAK0807685.1 hypothetical protein LTR75_006559 [Friedmanniomyces endolithicus]KAK0846069.1 hypothetical protein LTR03_007077 [Friedmanniomyces endolithicus]